MLRSSMKLAFLLHCEGTHDFIALFCLPLSLLLLATRLVGILNFLALLRTAPSFGLGLRSEVLLTGGPELRGGREVEEEEGGREAGGPLFSSLLSLLSPCFAGWDEFLCADCGLPSSTRLLDKRQGKG